jgi:hypothetical protein
MTKTRYRFLIASLAAWALAVSPAAAGMGQAGGQAVGTNQGNGGALFSGLGANTARPAQVLSGFVELTQADLAANAALLSALGLAGDAGTAAAQSAGFTVDTTPGQIETAVGATAAARQLVLARLAGSPALAAENQAAFAAGAVGLAQAVKGYSALTSDIVAIKKAMTDAGAKGRLALYAVKTVPATLAQARQQLQAMVQFAKANNISLAAEVEQAAAL